MDVPVVEDPATSQQYLIGVATPENGAACPARNDLATVTLEFLLATPDPRLEARVAVPASGRIVEHIACCGEPGYGPPCLQTDDNRLET